MSNIRTLPFLLPVTVLFWGAGAIAQSADNRPWENPNVPIVIDPYAGNSVEWDKVVTDRRVAAVIHKASEGSETDGTFLHRATEAKKRGLLWGAYHLGRPGDPIAQADLLIELANKTGAKFLAIDIEEDNPAKFMSLDDAVRFIEHVQNVTHRYPAVYVNFSVYKSISQKFDKGSVFSKTPLWIARFKPELGMDNHKIWQDYTLWQFSSEINCSPASDCWYRVPGTATDMDVNVFRGNKDALRALFE
jgi:lysozyme